MLSLGLICLCTTVWSQARPDSILFFSYSPSKGESQMVAKHIMDYGDSEDRVYQYAPTSDGLQLGRTIVTRYQHYTGLEHASKDVVTTYDASEAILRELRYKRDGAGTYQGMEIWRQRDGELHLHMETKAEAYDEKNRPMHYSKVGYSASGQAKAFPDDIHEVRYNALGHRVVDHVSRINESGDLVSRTFNYMAYDEEGRLLSRRAGDALRGLTKDSTCYAYRDDYIVMRHYGYRDSDKLLALRYIDSTFLGIEGRPEMKRKHLILADGSTQLREYRIFFYHEEKVESRPRYVAPVLASITARDYGNHTADVVFSELDPQQTYQLSLFDVMGRLLASQTVQGVDRYEIRDLQHSGFLLASIGNSRREVQSQKLVIR